MQLVLLGFVDNPTRKSQKLPPPAPPRSSWGIDYLQIGFYAAHIWALCNTKGEKHLDLCYGNIKKAFRFLQKTLHLSAAHFQTKVGEEQAGVIQ